jgi:hypothetical protein
VPTLDGVWRVERVSGVLPPVGLSKRIFGDGGWTLLGGVPTSYFRVRARGVGRAELDYVGLPVTDELTPRDDGSWGGRGLMFGREFCRFRLIRDPK